MAANVVCLFNKKTEANPEINMDFVRYFLNFILVIFQNNTDMVMVLVSSFFSSISYLALFLLSHLRASSCQIVFRNSCITHGTV